MATTFEFKVRTRHDARIRTENVLLEAHSLISQVESELSEFVPTSPIYKLNHARCGEPVEFTELGYELLKESYWVFQTTGSIFNPVIKSGLEMEEAFQWDCKSRNVWKLQQNAHLGFGAIGKGFALDRVRTLLERHEIEHYVLSAGGSSLIFSGEALEGCPWQWAWSWETDSQSNRLGFELHHLCRESVAVGVSGNEFQGRHLIGRKDVQCQSALVGHLSATKADAYSTALCIAGMDHTTDRLRSEPAPPAMATVDFNGETRWNGTFEKLWGSLSIFFISIYAQADEEIDLADLGFEDFTPYIFERNSLWVLAPLLIFIVVLIHLKNSRPSRPRTQTTEDSEYDPTAPETHDGPDGNNHNIFSSDGDRPRH